MTLAMISILALLAIGGVFLMTQMRPASMRPERMAPNDQPIAVEARRARRVPEDRC